MGATLWFVLRDDPYVAPPPGDELGEVEPAAAGAALRTLTQAVADGQPEEAAALAAADDTRTAELLRSLVTNATAVPLHDVDLRYVDELGGVDASGEWSATVAVTWRVSGTDERAAATDVRFDFATVGGSVVVTGVGGEGATTPVWMSGPLDVRRNGSVVVMAATKAERYSALAGRAVTVVRRVLPAWDGSLVVEVPRRAAGVDAALGVEPRTFRNVAGVTASVDGVNGESAPVHVLLNPAQMRRLRPVGAQVVVSHEAVHVATNAPDSELPTWLTEGFADYVALRDVDLPLSTTAAQVIDLVRASGAPRSLPDDSAFDEQSDGFGAAYEGAWLACRLLVSERGEGALVRLYRRADGSKDFEQVFRRIMGDRTADFTRTWQDYLVGLAA